MYKYCNLDVLVQSKYKIILKYSESNCYNFDSLTPATYTASEVGDSTDSAQMKQPKASSIKLQKEVSNEISVTYEKYVLFVLL